MQALKITFTTPTSSHGTKVKVSAPQGERKYQYSYELSTQENVVAAAKQYIVEQGWEGYGELSFGNLGDGIYVATFIPMEYIKARDAVVQTCRAISKGDVEGNLRSKPWVQAITDLAERGAFSRHYCLAVASE